MLTHRKQPTQWHRSTLAALVSAFLLGTTTGLAAPSLTIPLTYESYDGQTTRDAVATTVAVTADGTRIVAGSDDHSLRVWDAQTGQPLVRLQQHHTDWIRSVRFSPSGDQIASVGADRLLRVTTIDTPSTTTHTQLRSTADGALLAVAFHPTDGRLATVGFGDVLRLHDPGTGEETIRYDCACEQTCTVRFSPDGRWLAAAGRNGTVRVWDLTADGQPQDLASDGRRLRSLVFSPDSTHLAAAGDGPAVRIWRFDSTRTTLRSGASRGAFETTPEELLTRPGKNHAIVFLTDQTLAVGGTTGQIALWDLPSRSQIKTLKGHTGTVAALASTEDGHLLVSSAFDATVRVWDLEDLERTASTPTTTKPR